MTMTGLRVLLTAATTAATVLLLSSTVFASSNTCGGTAPPPAERKVAGLVVFSPPPADVPPPGLRFRTQERPQDHVWIGPDVPSFVPLEISGDMILQILDPRPNGTGWVALYRERLGNKPVDLNKPLSYKNDRAEVRIFDCAGALVSAVPINPLLSRKDYLEVQDIRYAEDNGVPTLYFNEACSTYSAEAGGRCSSLVAIDPIAKTVRWRTPSLVSNNYFQVKGDYIIAAYGFTAEPNAIRVVRRRDGAIVDKKSLGGTNFEMFLARDQTGDVVSVERYMNVGRANFRLVGFDGATPKLAQLPSTPDPKTPPGTSVHWGSQPPASPPRTSIF